MQDVLSAHLIDKLFLLGAQTLRANAFESGRVLRPI
jgi:hypothetical protein